jgi:hypothetical protein
LSTGFAKLELKSPIKRGKEKLGREVHPLEIPSTAFGGHDGGPQGAIFRDSWKS